MQPLKRITAQDMEGWLPKRQKNNVGEMAQAEIKRLIDDAALAILSHSHFEATKNHCLHLLFSGQVVHITKVTRFFPPEALLLHNRVVHRALEFAALSPISCDFLFGTRNALILTIKLMANDTCIAPLEEAISRQDPNYLQNLVREANDLMIF